MDLMELLSRYLSINLLVGVVLDLVEAEGVRLLVVGNNADVLTEKVLLEELLDEELDVVLGNNVLGGDLDGILSLVGADDDRLAKGKLVLLSIELGVGHTNDTSISTLVGLELGGEVLDESGHIEDGSIDRLSALDVHSVVGNLNRKERNDIH